MNNFLAPCVIALMAIAFDIIAGFYQAWVNSDLQSKAMKKGLQRKGGEVLFILMILIFNETLIMFDIYDNSAVAEIIKMTSLDGICTYIALKEATSIAENLCKANRELAGLPIMQHLRTAQEIKEDVERKENELSD